MNVKYLLAESIYFWIKWQPLACPNACIYTHKMDRKKSESAILYDDFGGKAFESILESLA